MKTSTFALAAAAVLALGACGSGDSEPAETKTVTESPSGSADVETADDEEAPAADDMPEDAPEDVDPEDFELPSFKSPEDMATQPAFKGKWSKDGDEGPCSPEVVEADGVRDPESGDVVNYKWLTCWSEEVSGEQVGFVVFEKGAPPVEEMVCAEYKLVECFAGEGWAVYASGGVKHLAATLDGLGVDAEAWGIDESLEAADEAAEGY